MPPLHYCCPTGEGRAALGSDSSHSPADSVCTSPVSSLHLVNQSTPQISLGLVSKGFFKELEKGGVFKWKGELESLSTSLERLEGLRSGCKKGSFKRQ